MLGAIVFFAVIAYAIHVERKDRKRGRQWSGKQLADKYMRTGDDRTEE